MQTLGQLSNEALLQRTRELVKELCVTTGELLLHLGEVDERKLWAERGYPSMFAWCLTELGFSEDATYNRLVVARLIRRLPRVLDVVKRGSVHLTGLRLLAPHLDEGNFEQVIAEATEKSKRDIEELVARLSPKLPVPDSVRKLPTPCAASPALTTPQLELAPAARPMEALEPDATVSSTPLVAPLSRATLSAATGVGMVLSGPWVTPPAAPRVAPPLTPLAPDAYKFECTVDRAFRDMLKDVQGLLSHSIPRRELGKVMYLALELLQREALKRRFGVGRKARSGSKTARAPASRHVPAAISRAIYERDGGCCTFVDALGRRCGERHGLQLDHVEGFARTGVHSIDGMRLLCHAHNQLEADALPGFKGSSQHCRTDASVLRSGFLPAFSN